MRSADRVRKCLLFGVDRTYRGHHETDAFDPKRTLRNVRDPALPEVVQHEDPASPEETGEEGESSKSEGDWAASEFWAAEDKAA